MTHFILDCDDVLLDWQSGFVAYLAARNIHVDPAGPKSWCLAEWIGCSPRSARAWVGRFNASEAFGNLSAMPGAVQFVGELTSAGHTCSVLTACGDNDVVRYDRAKNLWGWFSYPPSVGSEYTSPLDRVIFLPLGASKREHLSKMSASVLVEDSFRHARDGAALGIKSYCLRRSHNRSDENGQTAVIWVDDLETILHYEGIVK